MEEGGKLRWRSQVGEKRRINREGMLGGMLGRMRRKRALRNEGEERKGGLGEEEGKRG